MCVVGLLAELCKIDADIVQEKKLMPSTCMPIESTIFLLPFLFQPQTGM